MYILGIHDGHDCSAALMKNGSIIASAQEERFTGLKTDYGYPRNATQYCLDFAGIKGEDIDVLALAAETSNPVHTYLKRDANFKMDDWVKEQNDFFKPYLIEKKPVNYWEVFKDRKFERYDEYYETEKYLTGWMDAEEMKRYLVQRVKSISKYTGVPLERIRTLNHEICHIYYAIYGSPYRNSDLIVFTAEGIGDYSNGTVSVFSDKTKKLDMLAWSDENHLGHLYQFTTLILGMNPCQHEYKVMGLAPYANKKELERSYTVFKDILKVDGLKIVFKNKPQDLYFYFKDKFEGHRFDGIAGALQKYLEDILCEWVTNAIKQAGIRKVVLSGGVAQNIKAAKVISELECVDDLFVCPASGDPSLSIGACYAVAHELFKGANKKDIQPLDNIYLGPEYSLDQIEKAIKDLNVESRYRVRRRCKNQEIAEYLANGMVIARMKGRMEFGLRALGNRTIMADPRDAKIIRKINDQIKYRDFWMPFTPSILDTREEDYIVNPKRLHAPFMTMAFDSTELARNDLIAALHPADFTVRPQIVTKKRNPDYFDLISNFEKITGVGGILNTSFNLHGEPIVLSPERAIYTLDNSDLDILQMENILIFREPPL